MRRATGPNIHLYIDRLILDGLPVDRMHAPQVQMAVEAELRRLLTEQGLGNSLGAGGAVPSVPARGMQFSASSTPKQMGNQIAQSVYSAIGDKR